MTTSRSIAPSRAYRPDLDGLRALAILSVMLYHARVPHLTGGFTGVDIFFVLSGYLIGGQIYAELRGGKFSFARFYQRRAKRILPAFLAVLAFTLAAGMVLLSPAEAADLGRSALAAALSTSNILFWGTTNYFAGKSSLNPMLMTWSLGVEEQFYAVIPLLMLCLAHWRRRLILPAALFVCAVSFALACAELGTHPMFVFYLLPTRAWELGAGVALAIAEQDREKILFPSLLIQSTSLAGLGLLLAPIFLLSAQTPFPGPEALPSVLGATLLIATPTSWIHRAALSSKPLVFVGRISYSLYLWHWPLLALLHIEYGADPPRTARFAVTALAFAAAVVSYYLIEQPFRCTRSLPVPLLRRYAAACAIALAVCSAIWLSRGVPFRFPELARMEQAGALLASDPCLAGYGVDTLNLSPSCLQSSAPPQVAEVAVWGDSHSAALAPGLRAAALAQGYGFVQLGKASCAPFVEATHYTPRIPQLAAECTRFNARVLGLIGSDARIRLVILNADWAGYLYRDWQDGWLSPSLAHEQEIPTAADSSALFVESLGATIRALHGAGKRVILARDVPGFTADPVWRVRTERIPARRALARWLSISDAADMGSAPQATDPHIALANTLLDKAAAESSGVPRVDFNAALCDGHGECTYRNGDILFYIDSNHLSAAGALYAAGNLRFSQPTATDGSMHATAFATNGRSRAGGTREHYASANSAPVADRPASP